MKPGLGRGLSALINPTANKNNDEPVIVSNKELQTDDGKSKNLLAKIPVERISPNPYQPRREFDSKALQELKLSILENGLIQPVTVRRTKENKYELISGERRLRACKEIGMFDIPAYILRVESKEAMLALSLIENLQREDLNPIEIADTYKKLLEECNLSHDEIAKKVGKERSTVTNFLRLLKLPEEIQKSLIDKEITMGHARALINVPSKLIQKEMLAKIKSAGLSVRKTEALIKKLSSPKKDKTEKPKSGGAAEISLRDLEDKLRGVFGTKVICKQDKSGKGTIAIEFYSNDELDRLFDLFDIIEKYN
ncbi:MAG: ParB/RepB/Spo0J family partition protein [Chlorobi bacterium]|nr:ParB/RepB/Spo0J family partition protein [Chlorobiota bacterium]